MENKSLRFYAIMALWVVLFVLLFISNRRVDLKTDINKSTSVSVSVEDTVSLSPSVVTTRAYSAGDDTYQAFFEILQNASCYQKFNQNVRSYSHDYEAHSITLRFADDASQNLLFTVYSDGVCQVNGKFVFLRSPDGNAGAIYQLLRGVADQRPGQNKNRGTQVVKLSVPFLFSSAHSAVPEPCVPRSGCRANQNAASCQEKESMEWRNGTERLQTLLFLVHRG